VKRGEKGTVQCSVNAGTYGGNQPMRALLMDPAGPHLICARN